MRTRSKSRTHNQSMKTLPKNAHNQESESTISERTLPKQPKQTENEQWDEERLSLAYIPEKLIGRHEESQQIYEFIRNCIMNRINRKVLYISGVPGCGKTASTLQILKQFKREVGSVEVVYVNSLTLRRPTDIYRLLFLHFSEYLQDNSVKRKNTTKSSHVEQLLVKLRVHHILVIDEFDFLYTRDEMIMYNLFEWATQVTDYLGIITITNTFDFTTKLSTKVNSRMGDLKLFFKPYSQDEIRAVIAHRLANCPYFSNTSIVYASKKLSQYSSDIRVILNILNEAVIQHKKGSKRGQIEIKEIAGVWEQKLSTGRRKIGSESSLHQIILNFLSGHGGGCRSVDLYNVLNQKYKMTQGNMLALLKQLEEMGLVTMKEEKKSMFPSLHLRLKVKE